jgi:hypothetical protein
VAMAGAPVTDFVDQAELSDGGWDEVMGGSPFGGKRLEAYRTQSAFRREAVVSVAPAAR